MTPLRLALVPGEPAGVGPELCVHLAHQPRDCALVAFADPDTLRAAADTVGLPLSLRSDGAGGVAAGELEVVPVPQAVRVPFGSPDPANAPAVIGALRQAAAGCVRGDYAGLVTGPVHKAIVNEGGIAYSGTTELLAEQAGCAVVMMLATPRLRVALVTTHLPLRAVPDALRPETLERVLRTTDAALRRDFAIARPVIAVLGLNPHAGEGGHLGTEEIDVMEPVLARLRAEGLALTGPLPADTAFLPAKLAGFDAVVAMYHDQGLPVLKHSGFEQAVNLTLGLPYPRVAVDHGTALDLAGRNLADPSSLIAAMHACAAIARRRAALRADGIAPGART